MKNQVAKTHDAPASWPDASSLTRALAAPFKPTEVRFKPGIVSGQRALALGDRR